MPTAALGARNDLFCHSLEHKLGIHGSPTCTMIYGDGRFGDEKGAVGWLIGEENKGLACMFTMMNNARLAVGMQGVGICEAATQKAIAVRQRAHAGPCARRDRLRHEPDHRASGYRPNASDDEGADARGARDLPIACAHAIDMSHRASGDREHWQERAALLTPIAKSFPTDAGVDVASLGIQVHGGMGFIEETGAARLLRDARIAPIYEGTNGIQAIDLVTRKLPLSNGAHVRGFIAELKAIAEATRASNSDGFGETADRLTEALGHLETATEWLLAEQAAGHMAEALAGATPYQRLFGLTLTGAYLAKGALAPVADGATDKRIALCRFAAENMLAESAALADRVVKGAESLEAARSALA